MKTLVLSPRFTDDSNSLWSAALGAGWDVVRLHGFRVEEAPQEAAIYGETLFADAVAEGLGVSVLGPPDAWLPALPRRYLQREILLTDLEGARTATFPAFVKPPDEKFFAARIYGDAKDLLDTTEGLASTTPVLVSQPVRFEVEYRAFVEGRRVAALSVYIREGKLAEGWHEEPGEREEALAFLGRLLADELVELPPAIVIDVGRLATGGWAVVEGNPAWASGLCDCDPDAVLSVLAAATVPHGSGGRWARDAVWTHPASMSTRERASRVEVEPLSPDRLADFLSFFEGEAFSDNPKWSSCYCQCFYEDHSRVHWPGRTAVENREIATRRIAGGQMQGLLAYRDGRVVGWCNAAPRALLHSLDAEPVPQPERVGTILCFLVAPSARNKGVATALLDAACDHLRRQGLQSVEANPRTGGTGAAENHFGPLRMYLAAGFTVRRTDEDGSVWVTKELLEPHQ